jgi:hypothetical protein
LKREQIKGKPEFGRKVNISKTKRRAQMRM